MKNMNSFHRVSSEFNILYYWKNKKMRQYNRKWKKKIVVIIFTIGIGWMIVVPESVYRYTVQRNFLHSLAAVYSSADVR